MKPVVSLLVLVGALVAVTFGVWTGTSFLSGTTIAEPRLIRVDEKGTSVDVIGLIPEQLAAIRSEKLSADQWSALFSVRVVPSNPTPATDRPAMLGSYSIVNGVLRFRPRFPLSPGARYLATFNPGALTGLAEVSGPTPSPVQQTLLLPKPPRGEATTVAQVYPSGDQLPENLLRFYLQFTAPMTRGGVYQYIHLLGPDGKEVDLPFLELGEELWDRSGKRLTLFIDPGRIKRGVKPREDVGTALVAGGTYTLVIDQDWPDAEGEPLKETYRKKFRVTAPVDVAIDPKVWKLQPPAAAGREPLSLTFPRPLDFALLHRLLQVTDAEGRAVKGKATVSQTETRWEFTPETPWSAGDYQLVVDTRLEDVAGNRVGKPFEVDEFHPVEREVQVESVKLPFTVAVK
jgi:hypothetical protein